MVVANTSKHLELFDKLFQEFITDLDTLQPNDPGLATMKAAMMFLPTNLVVGQFQTYVGEYYNHIQTKNEEFFINELPKQITANSYAGQQLQRVLIIWKDPKTTDDTKDTIWKYFQCLSKLAKKISE
jgi:hypothetical protein